ncbi:SCO family protein [Muricauda sp. CAU 1633]|uniref:SCO family protein n=1 Tax=Allomuricauda sp. CAU 1633 TaxID=2816036 RepID=UPI001A8E3DDE|nr:SCO family protein [Muricauda sp. CAU 1633]MBO0324111.1 SCO family protein [Muricauda sp. CAU 1633]
MKTLKRIRWIPVALLLIVSMFLISNLSDKERALAIYNPADLNPELVDESLKHVKEGHTVMDFELINQNGEIITQEDYKDKIYVVDFFFSSCPTICPVMTSNMVKIQEAFLEDDTIKLLSISVTPKNDSVPTLRDYADKKGVVDAKWNITTGNKQHIYELARKSYFATTDEGDGGLQDFIHTSNFVLVDEKKQIRGIYNGLSEEEIQQLINDIKILNN